jgi:3-oxoacyl-[acyl-carrier protein] reductase
MIDTTLALGILSAIILACLLPISPIPIIPTPQEIANVVVFLAGEKSSFMTGITVPVDGGRSIR